MPATVQAQYFGGSATLPAGANAETGVSLNRADAQTSTTPIPIPTGVPAVNFSWLKVLQIAVTATSTTTITNRTVRLASAIASGLGLHWKTDTQANWATSFNQTGGSKAPADTTGTNNAGTPPAGYTALTTGAVQYDNTSQATSATGIGAALLLAILLAADQSFAGSAGANTLPNLVLGWDEA